MSISSALNNAISGLAVSSRAADVVSSNLANAMTDGYGVRSLDIGSRMGGTDGAGAQVLGVLRDSDPVLTGQRRGADATLTSSGTEAALYRSIEMAVGTPDAPDSLSARIAEFEARLIDAANGPYDQLRLGAAVDAAEDVATAFRDTSAAIQDQRLRADAAIGRAVGDLNQNLADLADINDQIRALSNRSGDVASLLDAQNRLLDQISGLVPIETRRDAQGALQVFSKGGEILLDRRAASLEFTPTPAIDATMEFGASILSGLGIDGRDLRFDTPAAPLGGGGLAALFAQRDDWAPDAQAKLDGVARDLLERFETAGLDPTLAPTAAGLFTDVGNRFDPTAEMGLSARITLNAGVQPAAGGSAWRLRDGLGAATEGPSGDATFLMAQIDVLSARRLTASDSFAPTERSMSTLLADQISEIGFARQAAETRETNAATLQSALRQQELERSVDTDAEMQSLLRIEQIYAANARVIQAAEAMMDELLRIAR